MASEPQTGSIIRTLAASKPGGRFLEIGTGTGIGTAWLLDGMDAGSQLDSMDNDPKALAVAPRQCDFIFADTWPGKFTDLDLALSLLRRGGIYLVDDLLPQPNWPKEHAPKVPALIAQLDSQGEFVATKLAWASGLTILVRTRMAG